MAGNEAVRYDTRMAVREHTVVPGTRTPGAAPKPNLGERLKELRLKKGLQLNDLAKSAGLSRSTLYKVENSGMSLTYEKLIRLSEGLGVEISELFRHGSDGEQDAFSGRREV